MPLPRWAEPLVKALSPGLIKALNKTWTLEFEGGSHLGRPGSPRLYAMWHGRQLALTALIPKLLQQGPAAVLTSTSPDGRLQAGILSKLGLEIVTGSSSRHGGRGLINLARLVSEGYSVIIAVDGPSGPVYCAKSGICTLSRLTKTPIVPVGVRVLAQQRSWVVPKTWDNFWVPGPGAKVHVRLGPPVAPPVRGQRALNTSQNRLQRRMAALNNTAPATLRLKN